MRNIVFVVGAGASVDFGDFPIGSELAKRIESRLLQDVNTGVDGPVFEALSYKGGYGAQHTQAALRIVRGLASRDSIDQFIDDCSDEHVALVAKFAIAHAILKAEDTSPLKPAKSESPALRSVRETWLGQVCRHANPGVTSQDFLGRMAGITFVTFNYDRCIEQFLLRWAQDSLSISAHEAAKQVRQVPVVHAFGQIGLLPDLTEGSSLAIPFGDARSTWVGNGGEQIKTFTEELDSEHGQRVRSIMAEAEVVVFLGFHYHAQNMQILFSQGRPKRKIIFGTTYKMTQRSRAKIDQSMKDSGNQVSLADLRCEEFMQAHYEEIFDH